MSSDGMTGVEDAEYKTTGTKSDEKALAKVEPKKPQDRVRNTDEMPIGEAARLLYAAGMARSGEDVGKLLAKLSFGRAIGLSDVAAINGLSISPNGALVLSAANMLALIQRSGKYKFKYDKRDDKICQISVQQKVDGQWESMGVPIYFSWDDAVRAGLSTKATYKQYPRQLLTARCISDVFKTCCADVAGVAVYTPEELPDTGYETDPDTMEMVPVKVTKTKTTTARVDEPTPPKTAAPKPKPPPTLLTEVKGLVKELKVNEADYWGLYKVTGWEQMDAEQLADVKGKLEIRKRATPKGG